MRESARTGMLVTTGGVSAPLVGFGLQREQLSFRLPIPSLNGRQCREVVIEGHGAPMEHAPLQEVCSSQDGPASDVSICPYGACGCEESCGGGETVQIPRAAYRRQAHR